MRFSPWRALAYRFSGRVARSAAYRRVSTMDQTTDRQLPGMEFDREFEDKCSGSTTNRPGLAACLDFIREGDALVVHSMDRLARNLPDMLALVGDLTKRGVSVQFVKEGLTFTAEKNPMQDLQLAVMGAVAQFELAMIRERQREGVAAAKRAGKHCGRKATLTAEQVVEVRARVAANEDKAAIARSFGVSRGTIYNALAKTEGQG
ncbi:recombinase family protein [Solidesulfovibrio sp.]